MKYMGSKSRVAKHIVPILQNLLTENKIETYIEPFLGGANIIDKIASENKYGSDLNPYLIALFKHLVNGGELPQDVSRNEYSKVRANRQDYPEWYVGCVGFLASYNGRFFDGGYAQAGYEKTQNGLRYRNYYEESKKNLLAQINDVKDVRFKCADYKDLSPNKSLIYCDPPYENTKQYNNSKNFNYTEFWETMRKWSNDNVVIYQL